MMKLTLTSYVGKLTRLFPALIFLILCNFTVKEITAKEYIPDFAFPQTVVNRSDSALDISIKKGDQPEILRNAMNICVANSLLKESDSLEENLNLLDSVSSRLSSPYLNIAFLLQAEILNQEYSMFSYRYDARNIPIQGKFPDNPNEWSGEMYKEKIYDLIESATSDLSSFKGESLNLITNLISKSDIANEIGMSLSEFIAFKGVDILKNFTIDRNEAVIPFFPEEIDSTVNGKCEILTKKLISEIIGCLSNDNSIIKALAIKEYSNILPDGERESYLEESRNLLRGKAGEGIILYELWNRYGKEDSQYYNDIKSWLESFPKEYGSDRLRYALSVMSQQRIEIEIPRISLPSVAIEAKVRVSNLEKGYLLLFKLENNEYNIYDELILKKFRSRKPLQVIEWEEQGRTPFSYSKDITIPGLEEGIYAIIPSNKKELSQGWNKNTANANYSTFRVTDIAIVTSFDSNVKNSGRAYVVKGSNQQPVEGATIAYFSGDSSTPKGHAITNKEGWAGIPEGYYRLEAKSGNSIAKNEAGFSYYPVGNRNQSYITILTDLSVYRPGDTLQYVVIGWKEEKYSRSLVKNSKVEITLFDANYEKISSDTIKLNIEGRSNGKLAIPKGRLLGNYSLNAVFTEEPRKTGGSVNFRVEEYKLPPFQVEITKETTDRPDMIKFKGCASTYTNLPVTDGEVRIKVEYIPWQWGFRGSKASFQTSLQTDAQGYFEIGLPLSNLKGTIYEYGRYSITAEVTSMSGETVKSSPLFFYLGNEYDIRPSVADKIEIKKEEVVFHVPVYDMAGLPIKKEVDYRIFNINDTTLCLEGKFESPSLEISSEKLRSGRYRLEFRNEITGMWVSTETVLWREDDLKPPYPTPLWIPQSEYTYSDNTKNIDVTFGSFWNDWILYYLSDGEKLLQTGWLAPSDSLIKMDIEIPSDSVTLFLTLSGMHDFETETGIIKIVPAKSLEKMEIITSSFRDNISAGEHENWTFSFKINDKPVPFVNAIATMSDKALNSINDFKWKLNIWSIDIYSKIRLTSRNPDSSVSYRNFTTYKFTNFTNTFIPDWQTYGYPWISSPRLRYDGVVTYKAMASRNAMMDTSGAMKEEAADEAVAEESQENEEEPVEDLRPVEYPLAFFQPDLKGNDRGEVEINFTVPNYNTTWQFQLVGYDEKLQNAVIVKEAIASKPVMVKCNLPPYLLTGDNATVSATLYNNSGKNISLGGVLEIFNAETGEILQDKKFEEELISPSANRIISLKIDVTDKIALIGVRGYAIGDGHSDGEQGFIPVLPSSTPVTESTVFYANSREDCIEIKLPQFRKNANVTLKYCDNPLWEVLLSLPGLKEANNESSLSISKWLFATILSENIINKDLKISDTLRKIFESGDSSLLKSNLQKDNGLKIVSLEMTPWINNANNETLRIRSLKEYLDSSKVESSLRLKTAALEKLQMQDGGFTWFEGMKSSPYITSEILRLLGYLNSQNLLSSELQVMARKAVTYYDRWLEERSKRDKRIDVELLLNYFYSRDKLTKSLPAGMKKLEAECLDSIKAQWKWWTIGEKCMGAIILESRKNYNNEVRQIQSSIKEFINAKTSLTEDALILEFLTKVDPESEIIPKIHERMFLSKETQDWGVQTGSIGFIYALIKDRKEKDIDRTPPEIYINGERIILSQQQTMTGNYTVDIDPADISGKQLVILRDSGIPAWGGIISQFVEPIREVKASGTENLIVEKRIVKSDSKGRLKEVSTFKKGDKVTVIIYIRCGKNMDYVAIKDLRSACLQPSDHLSQMINIDGVPAYRNIGKTDTSFFVENLPEGNYIISYECYVERDGEYSLGMTEVQSLYSPSQVSHSRGNVIKVDF